MQRLAVSSQFQKQFKKLTPGEQRRVRDTLKGFLVALQVGTISGGYGFKKINGDKYEIRVDLKTRIVMKAEGDVFVCHLLGSHDEVKRFLKTYRHT